MACFTKVLFPLSARSTGGVFSDIHCEDLGALVVIKFTKVWSWPHDWITLELLTFRLVHTKHLASFQ